MEAITAGTISLFLAAIGAIGGFFWRILGRIDAVEKSAHAAVGAVTARVTLVHEQHAEFREKAAATFATRDEVLKIGDSVREVGTRIDARLDKITERLDRIVDTNGG